MKVHRIVRILQINITPELLVPCHRGWEWSHSRGYGPLSLFAKKNKTKPCYIYMNLNIYPHYIQLSICVWYARLAACYEIFTCEMTVITITGEREREKEREREREMSFNKIGICSINITSLFLDWNKCEPNVSILCSATILLWITISACPFFFSCN